TVIVDNVPKNTPPYESQVLDFDAPPGALTRLTALTLDGGPGIWDEYNKCMVGLGTASKTWRIDHVHLIITRTSGLMISAAGGVIDHCTFDHRAWRFGIYG